MLNDIKVIFSTFGEDRPSIYCLRFREARSQVGFLCKAFVKSPEVDYSINEQTQRAIFCSITRICNVLSFECIFGN